MFEINGKTAVVTGGANGIGLATVKMLLENGANVVMSDYNEALLVKEYEVLKKTYGDKVTCKTVNVVKEEEVKAVVELAVEKYGELDIMVNNAGITGVNNAIIDNEDYVKNVKEIVDINMNGVIYGGKYAANQMVKQGHGGAIVNTASMYGVIAVACGTGYCGSKHAVVGITKTWALELAQYNIRVNALCPGCVVSGIVNEENFGKEGLEALLKAHPISAGTGRLGNAEEMAHAVKFMIENTFLTGHALVADGGFSVQ